MSKIGKTLFGGTDRSAQRATQAQNALSQDFIKAQEGRAQGFLSDALPGMQQSAAQGFQGAADVYAQMAPQQIDAMQQGNVAAQQYLMGGMPAFQAALMGQPMNYNPQPFQGQFDMSGFQRQVVQPPAQGFGQQMPQQSPINFASMLGGGGFRRG